MKKTRLSITRFGSGRDSYYRVRKMNKEYLENVLSLLTVVILIDEKVYPEEVETFSDAVQRISEQIDPNILFTKSMAADWFRANREGILLKLNQDGSEGLIAQLVQSLRRLPGHKEVFFNMIRIAHADQEYHHKEHMVIKMAADAWNIPYQTDESTISR